MDPLGVLAEEWQSLVGAAGAAAPPAIEAVDLESMRSWQSEQQDATPCANGDELAFPIDAAINARVYIFEGKIWNLRIDSILNTTNEGMNDRTGVSGQILLHAGPQLEEEIYQTEGCRTGECRMTRAYLLPAKKIIHTVGPRYNERYVTGFHLPTASPPAWRDLLRARAADSGPCDAAAESALHYCYRNALEMAVENKMGSIALPCVYTERKGYPRREAAHIAIRTVRRFMEPFSAAASAHEGTAAGASSGGGFTHVVFVVDNKGDLEIYRELMRLYFPRNGADAQYQRENLPADVGNAKGEPVVEERQVLDV